jgi:hypothetical protein
MALSSNTPPHTHTHKKLPHSSGNNQRREETINKISKKVWKTLSQQKKAGGGSEHICHPSDGGKHKIGGSQSEYGSSGKVPP